MPRPALGCGVRAGAAGLKRVGHLRRSTFRRVGYLVRSTLITNHPAAAVVCSKLFLSYGACVWVSGR